MIDRAFNRCLLRPCDLRPSHEALEVVGAFNPGAVRCGSEVVLLVRVAEQPRERREGFTGLPRWHPTEGLRIDWVADDRLTAFDPRVVRLLEEDVIRLTFISHIRVVRSADGRKITSTDGPLVAPVNELEEYGVEDPRITRIGDTFCVTYVAVSRHGAGTALAVTRDFETFDRRGIIFCPENKDVVLFPEKIGGEYVALHRPNPAQHFSAPEMWLARSPDLVHWGGHRWLDVGKSAWESGRVGAGPPPVALPEGWLQIYHGTTAVRRKGETGRYVAAAVLLDRADPSNILARSTEPIMAPEADFEVDGFLPQVVFPTGVAPENDSLLVYYGAADANTGVVEFAVKDILATLH